MHAATLSAYETKRTIDQYLLFHYGSASEQLPYAFGPHASLHFPICCVTQSLNNLKLASHSNALDLGCAVGRASFELARHFAQVVAIDNSQHFIAVAKQLQRTGKIGYHALQEADIYAALVATVPTGIDMGRVDFRLADASTFFKENASFDFVLAANLICRLADPRAFLETVQLLVNKGGVFALASPYSWLEEFTPQRNWLGGQDMKSFDEIQEILAPSFSLIRTFDLPFLIREHARKYQWGISQMSLWRKN